MSHEAVTVVQKLETKEPCEFKSDFFPHNVLFVEMSTEDCRSRTVTYGFYIHAGCEIVVPMAFGMTVVFFW